MEYPSELRFKICPFLDCYYYTKKRIDQYRFSIGKEISRTMKILNLLFLKSVSYKALKISFKKDTLILLKVHSFMSFLGKYIVLWLAT